jgi:hypothetical protein
MRKQERGARSQARSYENYGCRHGCYRAKCGRRGHSSSSSNSNKREARRACRDEEGRCHGSCCQEEGHSHRSQEGQKGRQCQGEQRQGRRCGGRSQEIAQQGSCGGSRSRRASARQGGEPHGAGEVQRTVIHRPEVPARRDRRAHGKRSPAAATSSNNKQIKQGLRARGPLTQPKRSNASSSRLATPTQPEWPASTARPSDGGSKSKSRAMCSWRRYRHRPLCVASCSLLSLSVDVHAVRKCVREGDFHFEDTICVLSP